MNSRNSIHIFSNTHTACFFMSKMGTILFFIFLI
nr:MAG TPA: hypothetical protein [Caudoviricetes sp.]